MQRDIQVALVEFKHLAPARAWDTPVFKRSFDRVFFFEKACDFHVATCRLIRTDWESLQ